jgi:hypothetical protein
MKKKKRAGKPMEVDSESLHGGQVMPDSNIVLAPLPQLKLSVELPSYAIGAGLSIRPFDRVLRRSLLNIGDKEGCCDDLRMLLLESELVFCAEVPPFPGNTACSPRSNSVIYSSFVAQEILRSIFNCLRLFEWVPQPLLRYCWFAAVERAGRIDLDSLVLLDCAWENIDQFTNIDWRSGCVEPEDITVGMIGLQEYESLAISISRGR